MRTVFSAILPIILIVTGVIIYFFYYKRSINAKLQGESGSSDHRIVSPWALAIVLLAGFTIINTTRNRADLEAMRQQLTSLNYNISQMQQQLSELGEADRYRYDLNINVDKIYLQEDSYYADIIIDVYPEISRSDDRITLYLDDQVVEMKRETNRFTAIITKPTLHDYAECSLLIESDGRQYHEPLYLEREKLYSDLFPFANCSGSCQFSKHKMSLDLHLWFAEGTGAGNMQGAAIVIRDGEQIIDEIMIRNTQEDYDLRKTYTISDEKNVSVTFLTSDKDNNLCFVYYLTNRDIRPHHAVDSKGRLIVDF
jgi:hypothetical protein